MSCKYHFYPTEPLCKIHQDAYDKADLSQRCNFQEIYQSNDLQLSDVLDCYRPQCVENQYKSRQCVGRWCWCSSSDGLAINGTLQKNMKADTCGKLNNTCEKYHTIYSVKACVL